MKAIIILIAAMLTGCATHQGTDGRTYYWIAPLPATTNGEQGIGGRSAEVTYHFGTVNGRGYSVSSFK